MTSFSYNNQVLPAFAAPSARAGLVNRLSQMEGIAPIVTFRILFGLLMGVGALRFMYYGWVEKLYGDPSFFFKFYGFSWVPNPGVTGAYILYTAIALSAFAIAFGWYYRSAVIIFLLTFTWSELIDATNYLNHYYLVMLLALLMVFIPANRAASFDAWRRPAIKSNLIPVWCRAVLMFQLGLVYCWAGIAKLNPDWLFHAMPLAAWLPTKADFPLLGPIFTQEWTAYAFSWFGAFYDLTIVAWLCWKPTRPWAYLAVVVFHVLTKLLFNIGLFPLIMIFSTLVFFPPRIHQQWLQRLGIYQPLDATARSLRSTRFPAAILLVFFAIQCLLPLRALAYPGPSSWTEEGYRFGWRVMLVEKSGQATFYVHDPTSGRRAEVDNRDFLTPFQEKQMAIQPDFILQYAHFLAQTYQAQFGIPKPKVTAEVYVALNGRPSYQLINPETDLAAQKEHLLPKPWILQLPH